MGPGFFSIFLSIWTPLSLYSSSWLFDLNPPFLPATFSQDFSNLFRRGVLRRSSTGRVDKDSIVSWTAWPNARGGEIIDIFCLVRGSL